MVQPNTAATPGFLLPTDFVDNFKEDINLISAAGFSFQDEKVKEAAKRALCSLGLAIGAVILAVTGWNLIWYTLGLVTKIAVGAGLYILCRDILERSKREKGIIAELADYPSKLQGVFRLALFIRNYAVNIVLPGPNPKPAAQPEQPNLAANLAAVALQLPHLQEVFDGQFLPGPFPGPGVQ